jgi:GNAT superfamily N-acetyltransferase
MGKDHEGAEQPARAENLMDEGYSISIDKSKLDIAVIHDYLSNRSYWAKGRTLEKVRRSIDNSLCFGVYDPQDKLVGFARVVTDLSVLAFLMDVFVLEQHRGRGLGKALIGHIMAYPPLGGIRRWQLGTNDAHGLYRKYGFTELAAPDKHMEKVNQGQT